MFGAGVPSGPGSSTDADTSRMNSDSGSSLGGTGMTGAPRLLRLMHPWSIAVDEGRVAARAAAQCEGMGIDGAPRPVHPARATLAARFI